MAAASRTEINRGRRLPHRTSYNARLWRARPMRQGRNSRIDWPVDAAHPVGLIPVCATGPGYCHPIAKGMDPCRSVGGRCLLKPVSSCWPMSRNAVSVASESPPPAGCRSRFRYGSSKVRSCFPNSSTNEIIAVRSYRDEACSSCLARRSPPSKTIAAIAHSNSKVFPGLGGSIRSVGSTREISNCGRLRYQTPLRKRLRLLF